VVIPGCHFLEIPVRFRC